MHRPCHSQHRELIMIIYDNDHRWIYPGVCEECGGRDKVGDDVGLVKCCWDHVKIRLRSRQNQDSRRFDHGSIGPDNGCDHGRIRIQRSHSPIPRIPEPKGAGIAPRSGHLAWFQRLLYVTPLKDAGSCWRDSVETGALFRVGRASSTTTRRVYSRLYNLTGVYNILLVDVYSWNSRCTTSIRDNWGFLGIRPEYINRTFLNIF